MPQLGNDVKKYSQAKSRGDVIRILVKESSLYRLLSRYVARFRSSHSWNGHLKMRSIITNFLFQNLDPVAPSLKLKKTTGSHKSQARNRQKVSSSCINLLPCEPTP